MRLCPTAQTGRVFLVLVAATLITAGLLCQSAAQPAVRRVSRAAASGPRLPVTYQGLENIPLQRYLPHEWEALKEWDEADRAYQALVRSGRAAPANGPQPPSVIQQLIDLTTVPRPPLVGDSTLCTEKHPFWSWDGQFIYFSSNHEGSLATYGTTTPSANARFHIYRMTADGAFIQSITGSGPGEATTHQEYAALNFAGTKLAYTQRGLATPAQLFILDLQTGVRTQITGVFVPTSPLNLDLSAVQSPSWSRGDNTVAFGARRLSVADDPLNIYRVDVTSRVVQKLTNGTPANGVECFDPVYYWGTSPASRTDTITFAANATGVNAGAFDLNYVQTGGPPSDLDKDGVIGPYETERNLFRIHEGGPASGVVPVQLTTGTADDIEPAYARGGNWSTFLAFASRGRSGGPNGYDIYFGTGSPGAVYDRLFAPDTSPAGMPLDMTDERSPTWSPDPLNDRIAMQSNRVNNPTSLRNPTVGLPGFCDIWAAAVVDITPPTLEMFDPVRGEVLHIANQPLPADPNLPDPGARVGTPGDTFYFYAKLQDMQSGIERVFVQIKDPDDADTDAGGMDHKLYSGPAVPYIRRTSEPVETHRVQLFYETDCQGINPSTYQYYNNGAGTFASYTPGIADAVVWSGNTNPPPTDGMGNLQWLELLDDGIAPDQVAGDGIYAGMWVSPTTPSDFFVDLIAYDNAVNPQNPAQAKNWIIYDDIHGFSTQSLISQNPVLFVNDNCLGQNWPRGNRGAFRPFPTFRLGHESEIIDKPASRLLQQRNRTAAGPPPVYGGFTTPARQTPYLTNRLTFTVPPHDGFIAGESALGKFAFRYDIWRILAKGPLPESILNDYLPTRELQPTNLSGTTTVNRQVSRRAVCWNSPYTGDSFLGAGSILDQTTHVLLRDFRNRGGRLVVAGGDIVWALTVGGSLASSFATDVLGTSFSGDNALGASANFSNTNLGWHVTVDVLDPYHNHTQTMDPSARRRATNGPLSPLGIAIDFGPVFYDGVSEMPAIDGVPFEVNDGAFALAGWEQVYDGAWVVNEDAATESKTCFIGASIGSLSNAARLDPAAMEPENSALVLCGYKQAFSHCTYCWMFSSELSGRIQNLNGGAPVPGAWVQVFQGGQLVGSAFAGADGRYRIRGIPTGSYGVTVISPGFLTFHKANGGSAHGLGAVSLDVFLVPAAPGNISGQVRDQAGQPINQAVVRATLRASPLYTGQRVFTAITGTDGRYVIQSAPVGQYDVDIESLPPLFGSPTPLFVNPVIVDPALPGRDSGTGTTAIDFRVQGQPGDLKVTVRELLPGGTLGQFIGGADVTLLSGQTPIAGFSGQTNNVMGDPDFGTISFTSVPAGPVIVSAFKFGFQEGIAQVNIPQQNAVTVGIATANAVVITGEVRKGLDGTVIDPNAFAPSLPDLELKLRVSQVTVLTTPISTDPPVTPPNNYRFVAQTGEFTVAFPGDLRFFPASVDVDVTNDPTVAPPLNLMGRPGIVSGTVVEDIGGGMTRGVSGATVDLVSRTLNPGTLIATTSTASDGSWSVGPVPSDNYDVNVRKFGYGPSSAPNVFVAGNTIVPPILLSATPRGQVYGLVQRAFDNVPQGGITVEFWTPATNPFGSFKVGEVTSSGAASPGPDGQPANYTIGGILPTDLLLPEGAYEVRVQATGKYLAFLANLNVMGGVAQRFDITLAPQSGVVDGEVREEVNGAAGPPLAGATVRIVSLVNGSTAATLTTDAAGRYRTVGRISGGPYRITASAFDFIPGFVDIYVEGDTTAPTIVLRRVPPSHITGTIRSSEDNALIAGVLVELFPASAPNLPPILTTISIDTAVPNYDLFPVRFGDYLIRVSKPGWRPQSRLVTVTSGQDLTNVNFTLQPEFVFGAGLFLISLPYDYPGQDAAAVLGIPPGVFRAASWLTREERYAIYPESPANEFRLGRALWVRFAQRTPFTNAGTPAPRGPFRLGIPTGWSHIGNPFRSRIAWLSVVVITGDGVRRTMQDAMNDGIIQNGLFGYADGYFRSDFVDPFSGYWVRAFQDVTLEFPDPAGLAWRTITPTRKYVGLPAPSLEQVARELERAGLAPPVPTSARFFGGRTVVGAPRRAPDPLAAPLLFGEPWVLLGRRPQVG